MASPLFIGLPAMMQNLPFVKRMQNPAVIQQPGPHPAICD
jgi:hypothetical protein